MRAPALTSVGFAAAATAAVLLAGERPAPAPDPAYPPTPAALETARLGRGQALAETAACAGCHSPPDGPAFAGARQGAWFAPNVTADPVSGIGAWSRDEVFAYLRTGGVPGRGQAAGPMAGVVEGLTDTPEADLRALVDWLRLRPPVRDPADIVPASGRDALPAAAMAGLPGAAVFDGACASCHGRDGAGSADGRYPSLSRNSAVGRRDPANLLAVLLEGVRRTTGAGETFMPGFDEVSGVAVPLPDERLAAVANYVLARFGDPRAAPVTAADVAAARAGR